MVISTLKKGNCKCSEAHRKKETRKKNILKRMHFDCKVSAMELRETKFRDDFARNYILCMCASSYGI